MLDWAAALAEAKNLAHHMRFRDKILEAETIVGLLFQPRHFMRQRADLELIADGDRNAFWACGLDEEIVRAGGASHRQRNRYRLLRSARSPEDRDG